MVLMALLLVVSPAFAAGSVRRTVASKKKTTPPRAHVISLTGTITEIKGESVYVQIKMTNIAFRSYRGDLEWVNTTSSTTYVKWTGKTRDLTIGFSDLAEGQKVSINGLVKDGEITARRIEVNKPRIP
jgi:hypothetical protein